MIFSRNHLAMTFLRRLRRGIDNRFSVSTSRRKTLWLSSAILIAAGGTWASLSFQPDYKPIKKIHADWDSVQSTEDLCSKTRGASKQGCPRCGQSRNFIADAAENIMPSVVNLRLESQYVTENGHKLYSSGSGVVIEADGTILTNAHVVTDISDDGTVRIKLHG